MGPLRALSIGIVAMLLAVGSPAAIADATIPPPHEDFAIGLAFLEAGDFRRAIVHFDALLAREPDNVEALSNRGMAKAMLGAHQRAMADYDRAIALQAAFLPAHVNRGLSLMTLGRPREAVDAFDRALTLDPRCLDALGHRAAAWSRLEGYEQAIADYRTIVEIDPQQADSLNNLAWILATCPDRSMRDTRQAVALALRATALRQDPMYFDTLAAAYAANGDFKTALRVQEQALALLGKESDPGTLELLRTHRKRYASRKQSEEKEEIESTSTAEADSHDIGVRVPARSGKIGGVTMPTLPFSIQVASCQEIEGARELTATLRRMGESAFFVAVELAGKGQWFRVFVGSSETRRDAEVHRKRILARGTHDALIVRTPYAVQVGQPLAGDRFEKLSQEMEGKNVCLYGIPEPGQDSLLRPMAGAFETQSAADGLCRLLHEMGFMDARTIRR